MAVEAEAAGEGGDEAPFAADDGGVEAGGEAAAVFEVEHEGLGEVLAGGGGGVGGDVVVGVVDPGEVPAVGAAEGLFEALGAEGGAMDAGDGVGPFVAEDVAEGGAFFAGEGFFETGFAEGGDADGAIALIPLPAVGVAAGDEPDLDVVEAMGPKAEGHQFAHDRLIGAVELIEGDDRASLRFHTGTSVMVNERQGGWEGKLCNRAVKIFLGERGEAQTACRGRRAVESERLRCGLRNIFDLPDVLFFLSFYHEHPPSSRPP